MHKHIIWMSASHNPTQKQKSEMRRLWPNCKVTVERRIWSSVDKIIERFKELNGDEMICILPMSIIRLLVRHGYQPIWSQMREVNETCSQVAHTRKSDGKTRYYQFVEFKRIVGFELKMESIKPEQEETAT